MVLKASKKDDDKDEDGDGVADVKQISAQVKFLPPDLFSPVSTLPVDPTLNKQ